MRASISGVRELKSKVGRNSLAIHSLFSIKVDPLTSKTIGSIYMRCDVVVKDANRSGALLSKHIFYICRKSTVEDNRMA